MVAVHNVEKRWRLFDAGDAYCDGNDDKDLVTAQMMGSAMSVVMLTMLLQILMMLVVRITMATATMIVMMLLMFMAMATVARTSWQPE